MAIDGPITRRIRRVARERELERRRYYLSREEVERLEAQRDRRRVEEWEVRPNAAA